MSYRLFKYRSQTLLETKSVVLEDNYNSFPFRIQINCLWDGLPTRHMNRSKPENSEQKAGKGLEDQFVQERQISNLINIIPFLNPLLRQTLFINYRTPPH